MPPFTLALVLQLVLALGLLNVWLVRASNSTTFRGRGADSLRDEFSQYGLPEPVFYVVGALKLGTAAALIAGLWFPALVLPAAALLSALMLGALAMHIKVGDPPLRSLPAALMLGMSLALIFV